eukprot:Gb_05254 [translate_table: standard]
MNSNTQLRSSEFAKYSMKKGVAISSVIVLLAAVVSVAGKTVESKAFHEACSGTLYPDVCVSTLMSHYQSLRSSSVDVANIAVKVALDEVEKVSALASEKNLESLAENDRVALEDCIELFGYTLQQLDESLATLTSMNVKSMSKQSGDIQTWLSASLTNQETCMDGLQYSEAGTAKSLLHSRMLNVSKLISNSLAIVKTVSALGVRPSMHNRRLLSNFTLGEEIDGEFFSNNGFPSWLTSRDRRLLQAPQGGIRANVIVAQDGTGNFKTISEAVNAAPGKSSGRFIIHVKAGIYAEKISVSKDNIMLIGDGKDITVVTGSVASAKLAAIFVTTGKGFIARDMTFENTAGPGNGQAVALRVGSDLSALYRCSIKGYQDTLYAYSQRQFYRECDIYGTVDFIFGNAAAVFQSCNILPRRHKGGKRLFITAQGRTDPNQNTGFSIHNCRVTAASDLRPVKGSFTTYLGRPWKQYSRTVYMQSFLDDIINPAGWFEWSGSFALKTLYYGEYQNSGPGAASANRVNWPGYRVITTAAEANKFTVAGLLAGNSWLPSTGVVFQGGLIG